MKVEEYFNSLEKKEVIYIFVSIPIVIFIIYYNFVYPEMVKENKKLIKIEKVQNGELSKTVLAIRKIRKSKNIIKPTREKLEILKENFKYISYNFDSLDLLKLDDKKIYNIFTKLLNKANLFNLMVSFDINWNAQKTPPFSQNIELTISGKGDYISILKYLQFIDHIPNLIIVSSAKIAISLNDKKDLKGILAIKKKQESNSLSFVLTKYSSRTLPYLKNLAKIKKLNLSVSVYSQNINYFNISFRGGYNAVKSVLELLKNIGKQKKEQKLFEFTKLKINLKIPHNKTSKSKLQEFNIKLTIVGVK